MQINSNNRFDFEGNFVADPKFTEFTKTGKDGEPRTDAVIRFTLALDGGKDGNSKDTAFISFEAWDTAADVLSEFRKGDRIAGFGMFRNNKWVDKSSGEERRELVCRVSRFYVVNRKTNYQDDYQEQGELVAST